MLFYLDMRQIKITEQQLKNIIVGVSLLNLIMLKIKMEILLKDKKWYIVQI